MPLNLPAIAAKTLKSYQGHPVLGGIYMQAKRHLARVFSPIVRAKWVHAQIDKHIQNLFKDPVIQKHSSCKKGCSACCHTQVSVNADEAALLANLVMRGEVSIDIEKLHLQKEAGDSAEQWYKISYENRGCVFLDSSGSCSIYEDRPSVCRTNYSVSDPSLCSTSDGQVHSQRLLNTFAADMVTAAGFVASKDGGSLPKMLWQQLLKIDKKKSNKKSIIQNV